MVRAQAGWLARRGVSGMNALNIAGVAALVSILAGPTLGFAIAQS